MTVRQFGGICIGLVLLVAVIAMTGTAAQKLSIQHSIPTPEGREVFKRLVEAFEARFPNIDVELSYVPWDEHRIVTLTKFAANELPDLIGAASTQQSVEFSNYNMWMDLSDFWAVDQDFRNQFYAGAFKEIGDFGIPWLISPETTIFYRLDMFREAGITPPVVGEAWTWEQITEAAKKLTRDIDGDGEIDQWGFVDRGKAGFIFIKTAQPYFTSAGADIIYQTEEGRWRSSFELQEVQEALRFYNDLAREHKVKPLGFLGWGFPEAHAAWEGGKIAMLNIGMWFAGATDLEFGKDWDVMLFPTRTDDPNLKNVLSGQDYWHIPEQADHPQLAWEFLKFFYEDAERYVNFVQVVFDLIPTTKEALAHPYYQPGNPEGRVVWAERFSQWIPYFEFTNQHPLYYDIWQTVVQPIVHDMISGKIAFEEAIKELNDQVNAKL